APLSRPARSIDHRGEPLEKVACIVWSRRRFRVVLNRECVQLGHGEPFARVVVQMKVRRLRAPAEGTKVDGETVVLRRDLDFAGRLVEDRLVHAAMPELELVRRRAESEGQQLMPEADAE